MKIKVCILALSVILFACKKDQVQPPVSPSPPAPFVEYRTPYLGVYSGIDLQTNKICGGINACSPLDTTSCVQNYTFAVGISSSNDSSILINTGNNNPITIKIKNGMGFTSISGGSQGYYKSVKFRNDSLFYYSDSRMGYVNSSHSWSYRNFSGPKQ